jgi:aldehyde:ferredoxin oxidoreductase
VIPGGYQGRYARVDLSTGVAREVPLEERTLRRFLGGSGLGALLLAREARPGLDALAPEAPLVFALSPLVGSPLTTSAKFALVSKSPLTGRVNDALASDRFAIELKRAGMDALVIVGAAPRPTLLVVDDGAIRLEDATALVGLSADDAEAVVRERLGPAFRFFGIGPAGENGVRFATASGDGRHAGRGGTGAVFGAKRLKGVAARGTRAVRLHDRDRVLALARDLSARSLGEGTAKYRELGTVANLLVMNRLGALPTRNFQAATFEGAPAISGEAFHAAGPTVRKHCAACTIGCEHLFATKDGRGVRLEYEGLFALGPLCGVADRETVLEAASRCDRLGLDVISAGGTIAFAMECRERGLLPDAPRFGDGEGLLDLLERIARRDGLGDLLADGSRRAAERLGGDAPSFACHVKGLEVPGYEPRALKAMAVGLAVGSRGADHNRSGAYEEDFRVGQDRLRADPAKGVAAARTEDKAALLDSLILCKFLRGVFDDLVGEGAAMLAAVTGWEVTADELGETAARIVNLRKLYNLREGWTRAEDTLPPRFLEAPLAGGASDGAALSRAELDRMIVAYYRARGWTDEGSVPEAVVRGLALDGEFPSSPREVPA